MSLKFKELKGSPKPNGYEINAFRMLGFNERQL